MTFIYEGPPITGEGGANLATCPPATNLLPTAEEAIWKRADEHGMAIPSIKGETDIHGHSRKLSRPPEGRGFESLSRYQHLINNTVLPLVYKGKRETSNLRRMLVFLFN